MKIRHVKFSKEIEEFQSEATVIQGGTGLEYWKQQLRGELPVMEWPANPVPMDLKSDRETYAFVISQTLTEKIHSCSHHCKVDLSVFLLAALRVMLYRYSGQEDLIIGNVVPLEDPLSSKTSDKKIINALPLRIQINGKQFFQDVLLHTKQVNETGKANTVPYQSLTGVVKPQEDKNYPALFQVLFHYKEEKSERLNQENIIPNLEINQIPLPDLILEIAEQPDNLTCQVNYHAGLLHSSIIKQMMNHFQNLLEAISENDKLPVGLLPLLNPDELHKQLVEFNQPQLHYTPECAHHLFEKQVELTPDAIAIRFNDQCLTYKELNSKANQLAHRLQKYGVERETIVGLCMHRSPQFLIGLLAILKAGGAFLPLDPSLPSERLSFMLEDAAPALIITQEGLVDWAILAQQIPCIYLDRDWPWIAQESASNVETNVEVHNLMYVIYTSGSSGKPKGVLIEHASLTSFLKAYEKVITINEQDKVLQFVPIVFDPMVEDIFCAFYKGATLVLRTADMADSAELFLDRCKQWGVTLLNLPASFWHLLVGELTGSSALQLPASIRIVKVGGERLLPEKVDMWKKRFGNFPRLLNTYGPTETTIAATMYDCIDYSSDKLEVPIGHRLMNVKAYVVDNHLQPVPMGVSAELCIGGDALARGYLNRADLEKQKFIPDPFTHKAGARMYRTGDLVRYLADGKLQYMGRLDDQVKIRGFRIELGEIESVLSQHESIKQVVVVVREEVAGDKRIVAYVVANYGKIEAATLRHYLLEHLPEYMIPAIFVSLDKLPFTFNGKVDRNALPAPNWSGQLKENYCAPTSHQEKLLALIWQKILHVEEVGVEDNFFEIGGYSLLASKLLTEIKQHFHVKIPLSWIFAHPTIREQAKYLMMAPNPSLWDSLITIRIGATKPPLYLIHDGLGGVEYGFQLSPFISKDRAIYGFEAVGLNGIDEPMKEVKDMAAYYVNRLLAHQPEGVYHLGGYSGGANITFEMAHQLKAKGKKVGMVVIFDSYPLGLNRFTYKRVGISFILRSFANLLVSSRVAFQEKLKILLNGVPQLVQENWIRVKFRYREKNIDLSKNPNEKIFRALRASNDCYKFRYYDGPLLFIRAIENQARYLRNSHFGWGRYARHVSVYDLPGDHLNIFNKKENAKAVANILELHLLEIESKINSTQ